MPLLQQNRPTVHQTIAVVILSDTLAHEARIVQLVSAQHSVPKAFLVVLYIRYLSMTVKTGKTKI